MIEIDKNPRFKTADGTLFATLLESQIHAISVTIPGLSYGMADEILKSSDAIIAILKMKPRKQRTEKPKNKPKKAEQVAK